MWQFRNEAEAGHVTCWITDAGGWQFHPSFIWGLVFIMSATPLPKYRVNVNLMLIVNVRMLIYYIIKFVENWLECIFVEIMLSNIIIQTKATKLDKVVHVFHTLQTIVRVKHWDIFIFLFVSYYFFYLVVL